MRRIERLRLLELGRLHTHLDPPRLIIIIGPPGSGKSSALSNLIAGAELPAAWIELSPLDDSTWTSTLASWQRHLWPEYLPGVLAEPAEPSLIGIDNLHWALDAQGVPTPAVQAWLHHLSTLPHLVVVVTSLTFPLLPDFARLAANGQVAIIKASQLAFTAAECQQLWLAHHSEPLPPEALNLLLGQTYGWAALVALWCRLGWSPDPYIVDLLIRDLVAAIPEAQRHLLTVAAALPDVAPQTINALGRRSDGERTIRELQYAGLLTVSDPIVVHPLIQPVLIERLQAEPLAYGGEIDRLGDWYAQQGEWEALVALLGAVKAWDRLVALLTRHSDALATSHRSGDVIRWLKHIPAEHLTAEGQVLMARCVAMTGDANGALLMIDGLLGATDDPREIRTLHLLKANIEQSRSNFGAADALVRPYLDDASLNPLERARALRIHGIALAVRGDEDAALLSLEQACALASTGGESRLLAMVFGDCGNVAARLGRYILAERTLGLAERAWITLGSPPDIAVVLNMRAVVALHTFRLHEAGELAQQAYVRAMAGERRRGAAAALATLGDVAFVQGDWALAHMRYQTALEQARLAGNTLVTLYSIAMQAQTARHQGNQQQLTAILDSVSQAPHESPLEYGWMVVAQASARLGLNLRGSLPLILQALGRLGDKPTLAHGMLTLLLAEAQWVQGDLAAAQEAWEALDQLLLDGRSGLPVLLGPIATLAPALLRHAHQAWASPFAQRLATATPASAAGPQLQLRLLGRIDIEWMGERVSLPRHGPELLALLLLAGPRGLSAELLRSRLWGDDEQTLARWNKVLQRVRKLLPDCIVLDGSQYRLAIPFEAIDSDVIMVQSTPLIGADHAVLVQAATYATGDFMPGSDAAWVIGEREALRRRGADLWLAVGNLERDVGNLDAALAAYTTALQLMPLHERAVSALLGLHLQRGQRADTIAAFLSYRQVLDDELGVDPSPDIDALYRRALNA